MASKWMEAALKHVRAPWAGEAGGEAPEQAPLRAGAHQTPEGIASWLAFHGVEIPRAGAVSPGVRRPR